MFDAFSEEQLTGRRFPQFKCASCSFYGRLHQPSRHIGLTEISVGFE